MPQLMDQALRTWEGKAEVKSGRVDESEIVSVLTLKSAAESIFHV